MISIFGIISITVAILSIAAIVLHNRVMGKRAPVDTYLAKLEELAHDRIEMLYQYSRPGSELRELCDEYIDQDLESILKALPEIDRAFDDEKEAGNLVISEPLVEDDPDTDADEYVTMAGLESNANAIRETTVALNQAIEIYNDYITTRPLEKLMAMVLGLSVEDALCYFED